MRAYNIAAWIFMVFAVLAIAAGDGTRGAANLGVALALSALDQIEQGQR